MQVRGRNEAREGAGGALLQGEVETVTYHDPKSLYSVLRIGPERGYDDPQSSLPWLSPQVTAVGEIDAPCAGQRLRLTGEWSSHRTHGRQFVFDGYQTLAPQGRSGTIRYLASDAFEGIGPTLAERIVDALGSQAIEVIASEPEKLASVQGLRKTVREKLVESVRLELGRHRLHAFLRSVGLGPRQSSAVAKRFGADAEKLLRADPYRLAGAVEGIGFASADRIARELGFAADGPERCRAAVLHVLRDAANDGHTLLGESQLAAETERLLALEPGSPRIAQALEELLAAGDAVAEGELESGERALYLPYLAASERGLATNLAALLRGDPVAPLAGERELDSFQSSSGFALDDDQRVAVLGALAHPVALLTGGPGVGKTTIVRCVVALAEAAGARVKLASPTGRAAKRMSEATGRAASTIHRLLGFDPEKRNFAHDQHTPLECDLLVIDEMSMLDVTLAHHLFKAVGRGTRLLLVGDPDQLPSVAPGNVLVELIRSQCVPTYRLTHIHRQGAGSLIVTNAHRILAGEMPQLPARGDTSADFFFFPADEPAMCADRTVEVVTERIPRSFGFDWTRDVQVLAPMYRGDCGVDVLNERLRASVGGGASEFRLGTRSWRIGDRVIQTRNDYEKDVFNGDMGRVVGLAEDGLRVQFPDRAVKYAAGELGDLQPAFAITVHRAQGSEYDAVVLPLVPQHYPMLQRNLLYTAVTRARKLLVVVGSLRALRLAIDDCEPSARRSALARRLRALLSRENSPP